MPKTTENITGGSNGGDTHETHKVGQEVQGGIVIYITPDGKRGLVVAKQQQIFIDKQ